MSEPVGARGGLPASSRSAGHTRRSIGCSSAPACPGEDERAATVTGFTRRALDFFLEHDIVAERLLTYNAFTYIHNRRLRDLLHRRAIQHIRTRPYTPRTNGKVERYQQTLQREWAYALEYASSDARRASLPHWVRHYNQRRTHSALGNRPPLTRVREVTGLDS